MATFKLAGGRPLPPLLFVTCPAAIKSFSGNESTASLRQLIPAPHRIVETPEDGGAEEIAAVVRQEANRGVRPEGVVILGGYDTVPAHLIRAVYPGLLTAASIQDEPDDFIVWNDDIYGDLDGDGLPEVPVSRIPGAVPLRQALRATPTGATSRPAWKAIRIDEFDYADTITDGLTPAEMQDILNFSKDTMNDISTLVTAGGVEADRVYFACHSDYSQANIFKTFSGNFVITSRHIPKADGSIVVAACCYSATIAQTSPLNAAVTHTTRPRPLPKSKSIAVTYIANGAQAFIGSTGWLWVPDEHPYSYYVAPLHQAFWRHVADRGLSPARALFEAKAEYILGFPYANPEIAAQQTSTETSEARHLKDYWSATCLGLGW